LKEFLDNWVDKRSVIVYMWLYWCYVQNSPETVFSRSRSLLASPRFRTESRTLTSSATRKIAPDRAPGTECGSCLWRGGFRELTLPARRRAFSIHRCKESHHEHVSRPRHGPSIQGPPATTRGSFLRLGYGVVVSPTILAGRVGGNCRGGDRRAACIYGARNLRADARRARIFDEK
jgi:hypothetical protein